MNPPSWRLLILPVCRASAGDFFELPLIICSLTAVILMFSGRIWSNVNTVLLCFTSNADLEYPVLLTSLSVYLFLGSISFLGDILDFLGRGRR